MAAPLPNPRPQVRTPRRVSTPSPRRAPRAPQPRLARPRAALLRRRAPTPL
jgi:hypothetical protein